jgi:hypothetical protein
MNNDRFFNLRMFARGAGLLLLCAVLGCSEKAQKAMEVLKEKSEDQLVKMAGEGEVALKLSQEQYAAYKEKLVRIKTLRSGMERMMEDANSNASRLRAEGAPDKAGIHERQAAMYAKNLKFLAERQPLAEAALRDYGILYEQQKEQVKLLHEEIAAYKATGGLNDHLSVNVPIDQRKETIENLIRSLKAQSDRAKALFEVGEMEHSFR